MFTPAVVYCKQFLWELAWYTKGWNRSSMSTYIIMYMKVFSLTSLCYYLPIWETFDCHTFIILQVYVGSCFAHMQSTDLCMSRDLQHGNRKHKKNVYSVHLLLHQLLLLEMSDSRHHFSSSNLPEVQQLTFNSNLGKSSILSM